MILHIFMLNVMSEMASQDGLVKEGLKLMFNLQISMQTSVLLK